ncbi:hypothetical protein NQZ68_002978 [Dissostichus eleginoides]|nr:hypothetical protein NQZ68_002978 [Dissostichus eleginoides]
MASTSAAGTHTKEKGREAKGENRVGTEEAWCEKGLERKETREGEAKCKEREFALGNQTSHRADFIGRMRSTLSCNSVKNTLAVPSFENRATPKTIRAGGQRDVCREISRSRDPRATQIQFPPFWLPKTKEFHRKSGQDLTPSHRCGSHPPTPNPQPPTPPPFLSCSHSHRHKHTHRTAKTVATDIEQ